MTDDVLDRKAVLESYRRYYNAPLAQHFELAGCSIETSAEGSRVFDELGREFLDMGTAHGIFGLGHCNPAIRAAIEAQAELLSGPTGRVPHAPGTRLTRRLAELLPGDLDRVTLAGSGSEGVEIALRTALLARPGRTRIVAARDGYHGKTLGVLGVIGLPHLRTPFEPLLPDVEWVRYGDADALARAVDSSTAAVVLEPVLAGGTIAVPPPSYLSAARAACDQTGALLIADEVQTGLGRTGRMFGVEHSGVVPDAIVLSKTLTGGHLPVAAVVVRNEIAAAADRNGPVDVGYGSDSAGWPLVAAAADAAVEYVVEHDLSTRAHRLGLYLAECLSGLAESFPGVVVGTPGIGLMRGLALRNRVIEHGLWLQLRRRGVIVGMSLNSRAATPVLRIYPPLTVSRGELDLLVEALYEALQRWETRLPQAAYGLVAPALSHRLRLPRAILATAANQASAISRRALNR
jgi:putrescine aminotransferase